MGYTEAQIQQKVDEHMQAISDILLSEEAWMNGRRIKRSQLEQVQKSLEYWEGKLDRIQGNKSIITFATFREDVS